MLDIGGRGKYSSAFASSSMELVTLCAVWKQMESAGLRSQSSVKYIDGQQAPWPGSYVCVDCAETGNIPFVCSLCGKTQPSEKLQETIHGDPPEYLCSDCWSTLTAKAWQEKVKELTERHQYDFE